MGQWMLKIIFTTIFVVVRHIVDVNFFILLLYLL